MYKSPSLTVDGIVKLSEGIVLIKRKNTPFKGLWALPGGFVDYGEKVENALLREMKEEISIKVKIEKMLGVYSDPERDPRGHTVSIVYICETLEKSRNIKAADDAAEVLITPKPLKYNLAFDHEKILKDFFELE
ncbi:MAG: NUDIX domain-containing protein [Candidatus Muiribacteriota bacterium]